MNLIKERRDATQQEEAEILEMKKEDKNDPEKLTQRVSELQAELAKAMEGYGSSATEPPSTSEGRTIQAVIKEKGVTSCGWTPTNGKVTPFKLKPEEVEARGY